MKVTLNGYQKVLTEIQKTIAKTQANIVLAVNRQKVEMCWQLGKITNQHLLKNERAEYREKFFEQLAQDTGISKRILYQMRSFYKAYPKLPKDENGLKWSHYRNLASVKDDEKRKYLEDLTLTNNLGAKDLQSEITKSKPEAAKKPASQKLKFQRGKLFTYKIKNYSDTPASFVDCGFHIFSEIKSPVKNDGEVFESVKKGNGFSFKKSSATSKQLHTYKAFLERVIDGDTILVTLDLGFKIRHREILRLAKINASEVSSEEGKKSAAALEKILKDVPFLILKTNQTDIYGRYIADVFFDESKKEKDPQKVADGGVYLNQMLLDRELVTTSFEKGRKQP